MVIALGLTRFRARKLIAGSMTEHQQGSSSRSEMSIASAKVAATVDAAERAAAELREHTEADVAATLAEAERERDRTVRAAQDEARGIDVRVV